MSRAAQSPLTATFQPAPIGQTLIESDGKPTQPFRLWLNALYKRFLRLQPNLRLLTGNTMVALDDCTAWFIIQDAALCTLPDPTQIQGQIFIIKNDATSTSTVTMAATLDRLIDNLAASTYVLSPGNTLLVQSDGTNWIALCRDFTNSQGGSSAPPLTPSGTTPPPPSSSPSGPPTVSAFPNTPDQGAQVIMNGILYQFVGATQFAGIPGFWEPVVATSPALQDTWANRALYPPGSYPEGTPILYTDREVVYVVSGGVWIYWSGAMPGNLADLPSDLAADDAGFPFQAKDFKHLYRWSGAVWAFDTNDQGSNFLQLAAPGFFTTNGLWGLSDGSTYTVALGNGTTTSVITTPIDNTYLRR